MLEVCGSIVNGFANCLRLVALPGAFQLVDVARRFRINTLVDVRNELYTLWSAWSALHGVNVQCRKFNVNTRMFRIKVLTNINAVW